MRILPALALTSVVAFGGSTAMAADTASTASQVQAKTGVRVVDPPDSVRPGQHNVPVGVQFTDARNRAKVRAVVVTLRKDGAHESIHFGKRTFRPGQGSALVTQDLWARGKQSYVVRYRVLTGPKGSGRNYVVEYPVSVAGS